MADENTGRAVDSEELEFGDEQPGDNQAALEVKYRKQMRQIMPQKIELPISTLPEMIKQQINLSPDFQRRGRWDRARQSRFIESIIMNVPIPPVFLGEDDYGSYVVLDGRQRLTAVHSFMRNTYKLKGLEVWEELNGLTFDDLQQKKLDKFFTRRFIPAVLILKESSPEVKYDVFDRLNTGAVTAEPMEIRNAVFQGKFNELIRELSDNHGFRKLWGIPTDDKKRELNQTYAKMYDLELVLRFFALREPEGMNLNFKDYLTDYLNLQNTAYKERLELKSDDERQFQWAVRNCSHIFGEDAFRKPPVGTRSAPLADAYMVALSSVDPKTLSNNHSKKIREALNNLVKSDEEFKKAISTGTNGKGAIITRINKAKVAVKESLQS
jgi:hypothetical protein